MIDVSHLERLATVSAFKARVRANRLDCRTDFARSVHDRLLGKLDEIVASLHSDLQAERDLAAARGTQRYGALHDMVQERWPFEAVWIWPGPISLLDPIIVDVPADSEHEIGRMELAGHAAVPAEELEGLDAIIKAIRRSTGIAFVAARVTKERRA